MRAAVCGVGLSEEVTYELKLHGWELPVLQERLCHQERRMPEAVWGAM